jgi:creatinine amidohydrolase
MRRLMLRVTVVFAVFVSVVPVVTQAPATVFLEEMTWMEVRDAVAAGTRTVIIPTGGTEQNGPHMVLGKHNYLVRYKAGEVAKQLGGTLVAPVMAYVPEGNIDPPTGHMRFSGTITTPQDVFEQVIEYAARSLVQHGFTDVVLLGDSGGNQSGQQAVADLLNAEWRGSMRRVHHVTAYYPGPGDDWLLTQGETLEDVGSHASIHDTASLLYLNPSMLRLDRLGQGIAGDGTGLIGNAASSTREYGGQILSLQIAAAVEQIQELKQTGHQ